VRESTDVDARLGGEQRGERWRDSAPNVDGRIEGARGDVSIVQVEGARGISTERDRDSGG